MNLVSVALGNLAVRNDLAYGVAKSGGNPLVGIQETLSSGADSLLNRIQLCQFADFGQSGTVNRGELFLEHRYNGVELKLSYATDTLTNLFQIWKRPVHIETVLEDHATILSFDGSEHTTSKTKELVTTEEE